jgi:hypothetical protein
VEWCYVPNHAFAKDDNEPSANQQQGIFFVVSLAVPEPHHFLGCIAAPTSFNISNLPSN